jgi:thiamine biosynthesis lipoprotein
MQTIALARNAMATRFEIVLHGPDAAALRAAGEEALNEIDRLESQLSLYRPDSEVARLNARAARAPVHVTPSLFRLLEHARQLSIGTGGAFDITIAPLVRAWGFMGGSGRLPAPDEIAAARAQVGMELVELDPGSLTVRFARDGVMIDLGAIGKGYAVERAAALLRETGITSGLISGGTSTIHAIGHPPGQDHWRVAIEAPPGKRPEAPAAPLASVNLRDEAFSVSAVWGRSFEAGDRSFGHVIDPRSGQPVSGTLLAAVALPSATETDALSTALLVLGEAGMNDSAGRETGRAWVIREDNSPAGFRLAGGSVSFRAQSAAELQKNPASGQNAH